MPESKKCRLCGKKIDEEKDLTLCGYGKCVKCCYEKCNHRTHKNHGYDKKEELKKASKVNQEMSKVIFS